MIGLPKCPLGSKEAKMKMIIKKMFLKPYGLLAGFVDIKFGSEPGAKATNGTALIQFNNEETAKKAARDLDQVKFGKKDNSPVLYVYDQDTFQ